MTKDPIINWDGGAPLIVNYHKGGNNFIELLSSIRKEL